MNTGPGLTLGPQVARDIVCLFYQNNPQNGGLCLKKRLVVSCKNIAKFLIYGMYMCIPLDLLELLIKIIHVEII